MNSTISALIGILVVVLVGITGATVFISERQVNRYKKEAEKARADAKKKDNELSAEKAENDIRDAGASLAKKVYKAVLASDDSVSAIRANTATTVLSEKEKKIAKEVSENIHADCN